MDILFLGTPAFACPSLSSLVHAGHRIVAVVTRTDKPRGRRGKPVPSEVKRCALEFGLSVLETERASAPEFVATLADLKPQIGVVVAFGEKLSGELLHVPEHGFVNVHPSLLPRYRGAAPITWAVVNGEKETGVTIIRLVAAIDAGPILLQRATGILPGETAGELYDRLADMGAGLLVEAVAAIENGTAESTPQPDEGVTLAPMLEKHDGRIPWGRTAEEIVHFIRGMTPWPGAFTFPERRGAKRTERVIVTDVEAVQAPCTETPGRVLEARDAGILVAAGEGAVLIKRLQPAGKREMSAAEYLRGRSLSPGDVFRVES
ncbi:MAG: methionyl-tRNA formyltransferase [Planctomycetes bacterium]|nr:methionyl-tRNA formyltransferase [Planctomycetota bacterium]